MLVRYRTNSSCTLQNFKDDINNIILGNVTSVNNLSSGADKVNSVIYGTYPTGKYARVNETSYTYSKQHSTETTYTHYFRLAFDSVGITSITLAQGYSSGSDTLLNAFTQATVVYPIPYVDTTISPMGIDILVGTNTILIWSNALQAQVKVAITDLGHTGITRKFTDSMLMSLNTHLVGQVDINCPYSYNYLLPGYSSISVSSHVVPSVRQQGDEDGITTIFENPVIALFKSPAAVIGTFIIPSYTFFQQQIYKDSLNKYRLTLNHISLLVD
jgi:hypothetical protein